MALLKIARMGNPVLRRRAEPVADATDPTIRRLVRDMVETMADSRGVGLAAPQVHVPLRVVVFHVPAVRQGAGEEAVPLTVLINPVIEPLAEETELGWEGCLSLPGMQGAVPRYTRIRYTGLDIDGQAVARVAQGYHARVVQHECDHLDGILYPARVPDMRLFGFVEEFRNDLPDLGGEPA